MSERAYVLIKAEKGQEPTAVTELGNKQELLAVDRVFGQYDIVALIEAEDLDGLIRIVGNDIATADHVIRTETLVITSGRKPRPKN
ncbi:MAG: Lrp/AsnC ligand binding domain-containing protein [Chloroflexi bacterium]|jgi:DNA-binding Lrp family transcriptional regulator|nr:Lrp/AsnC ligand binding domain-containing protein [Chloroflexota bacterium]